ncbi:hypothetical protein F4808DRAFT_466806 [Astrocystis sublimbata]|nr:hypothetical protein F4808DRAFT_466806 [Astrocystis sublimbata]
MEDYFKSRPSKDETAAAIASMVGDDTNTIPSKEIVEALPSDFDPPFEEDDTDLDFSLGSDSMSVSPAHLKDAKEQIDNLAIRPFSLHGLNGSVHFRSSVRSKQKAKTTELKSLKWHTKVIFYGYRTLLEANIRKRSYDDNPLFYATYSIGEYSLTGIENTFRSLNDEKTDFLNAQKRWQVHEKRKRFAAVLRCLDLPPSVDKVVCFGLGSTWDSDGGKWARHLAALDIKRYVAWKTQRDIRLVTHVPEYVSRSMEFWLKGVGFELDGYRGVEGFLEVDDNSVVFINPSNIPANQVVAELARPAAIITRSFNKEDVDWAPPLPTLVAPLKSKGVYDRHDPDTPRTQAMFQEYQLVYLSL